MWIVVVDEGCATQFAEEIVEFAFGADDTLERAEAQQVSLTHVGDDAEVGQDNLHQRFDFSWMVGSHLDDGDIVLLGELQEGFGHADVIVEVPLRVEHVIFLLQHRGDEFLCRGLAVGAGDADDRRAQMDTVILGELLEGLQHVINQDEPLVAFFGMFLLVDNGIRRSLFQRHFGIGIAVEGFTLQGKKHRTLWHIAAIGRDGRMLQEQFV